MREAPIAEARPEELGVMRGVSSGERQDVPRQWKELKADSDVALGIKGLLGVVVHLKEKVGLDPWAFTDDGTWLGHCMTRFCKEMILCMERCYHVFGSNPEDLPPAAHRPRGWMRKRLTSKVHQISILYRNKQI